MNTKSNCYCLASTSKYVALVDMSKKHIRRILIGQGLYYGITWNRENIFVVCADYHKIFRKIARPKVLVLDMQLKVCDRISPNFKIRGGVHQAYYDSDLDELWVTSSKDNSVLIYKRGEWYEWHPINESYKEWLERIGNFASKRWDQPNSDIHHSNSIWSDQTKIYLLAHNWGPSEVYCFDKKTKTFVNAFPLGKNAHNIWIENNMIHLCSSGEGSIVNSCGEISCQTNGFTRGVSKSNNFTFVGVSDKVDRRNRSKPDSKIFIYSKDWILLDEIILPQSGQINEIRFLGSEDICHNSLMAPCIL